MSDDKAGRSDEGRLDDWREQMSPRLAGLQVRYLPESFPFDYSRSSLHTLEKDILRRFATVDQARADWADDYIKRATGYVGETFLRRGGGSWAWEADAEAPVVRHDPVLNWMPVSPLGLVLDAVAHRSGTVLADAYDTLVRCVAKHQADEPAWFPHKEVTPGIDDILERSPSELLDTWLAEREAAFPRWIADYGGRDFRFWDFSRASLDALEDLVRHVVPSPGDVSQPAYVDFTAGAAWYLGEVVCRQTGAEWRYNEGQPHAHNPWIGRPYVKQMVQDGYAAVPILSLEITLAEPDTSWFREEFARFEAGIRK